MARFGTWKPLSANWASQSKMAQVDIISLHTMVGSLAGTDNYFRNNGYGGTFSHFGVGGDGTCLQWQDTAYRAAANYNGNWHIISVECADVGSPFTAWNLSDGSAVPAFTDAQCETLAQLIAAMCKAHDIPCQIIPDAKPGRRGIGWHRMGVPGYMVAGAEQWSTATGKVCPGNRRIAQVPGIVARANAILNGTVQEDDMPLSADDLAKVRDAVWQAPFDDGVTGKKTQAWLMYRDIQARVAGLGTQNAALTSTVNALTSLVAKQNGLTVEDVRSVVAAEIAKGIDVDVNVAAKTA